MNPQDMGKMAIAVLSSRAGPGEGLCGAACDDCAGQLGAAFPPRRLSR